MPPQRSKAPRGAQKWVLAELRALPTGARLSTADLAKRVRKASGKALHPNSIYNALRLLVKGGAIDAERSGHQKLYRTRATDRVASTDRPSAPRPALAGPMIPDGAVVDAPFPHKLALGEILVVNIENGEIVAATNLHGRLVVERHPLPE